MIKHVVSSSSFASSADALATNPAVGGQAVRILLFTGALLLLVTALGKLARAVAAMLAAAATLGTVVLLVVLCVVTLVVAMLYPLA